MFSIFHGRNSILPVSLRAKTDSYRQSNFLSYGIIGRASGENQVRKHSHTEYLPKDAKPEHSLLNTPLSANIRQDDFNLLEQTRKASSAKDYSSATSRTRWQTRAKYDIPGLFTIKNDDIGIYMTHIF